MRLTLTQRVVVVGEEASPLSWPVESHGAGHSLLRGGVNLAVQCRPLPCSRVCAVASLPKSGWCKSLQSKATSSRSWLSIVCIDP